MPNRIIKESICTSENLDELTPQEEVFFYRLLVNCDDYGICDARLKIIKAKCFPLKDNIKESDIKKWLNALIKSGLCFLYEVGGRSYLKITTWESHQQTRAKRHKFPTPDSEGANIISDEIICNHLQSDEIICNQMFTRAQKPIQSESESNPNPICHFEIENIFTAWNEQKIIVHRELSPDIIKAAEKALKQDVAEDIKSSIVNYGTMLHDEQYKMCDYRWSLANFLSRSNGYRLFTGTGERWINYQHAVQSRASPADNDEWAPGEKEAFLEHLERGKKNMRLVT